MSEPLTLGTFVDLSQCLHGSQFRDPSPFAYVGKALGRWLEGFLSEQGVGDTPVIRGKVRPGAYVQGKVLIDQDAVVEPTAFIQGPCYVGPKAEVRHGAYIRGNVYVGPEAVVGHATEVKGAVFFDHAKAGHFAYVGDGVLGRDTNLGAGTKLANLALARATIRVKHPTTGELVSTGLTKFSAIMGDQSQTGCNAVLSPGTLLMPRTMVLPCVHFRGTLVRGLAK